jgi:tetratricopeptide (TPR) repeat protein
LTLHRNSSPGQALAALGLCLALVWGLGCYAADTGQALVAEASKKIGIRDFAGAQKVLVGLLKENPRIPEAHNLLGVCQVELGALDAAVLSFRRALELRPAYASAQLNLASVLLKQGKRDEAAKAIRTPVALDPNILANDPNAATIHYLFALDYAQQGQTKQAKDSLEAAIRLKPGFTEARIALAKLELADKHEDAALEQFEAVIAQEPGQVFALGNAGLIFARRADYTKASERLSRAHELDPSSTPLALALAEAKIRMGQQADADRLISELQSAGRLSSDTRRILASVWLQSGQPAKGAALVGPEPELGPKYRDMAVRRAQDDFLRGKYEAAAAELEAVRNLGPQAFAFHRLLGNAYYELDNPQKASEEFQDALRLDPKNEQVYFNLGMLYLKFHTPDLAILVFEHGLKEMPDSPLLWMGMGLTQHLAERTEKAATALKKAVELDPAFTDAYIVLGDVLESDNKLEDALPVFETAIRKQPDLYIGYFYYGKILVKMNDGRMEQAIEALRKATRLRPEFAEGHYEFGRALEHAGHTEEAIAEYKACAKLDPALAESQYRLALLYRKQGDTARADLALAAYKKAQAAQKSDTLMKKLEYRVGNE